MFQLAEDESKHRRHLEDKVNTGNIEAQAKGISLTVRMIKIGYMVAT